MPNIDDIDMISGSPKNQYTKDDQWETFKESRGGKANVGECEVQILHLKESLTSKEKESLNHERRANKLQEELNIASDKIHTLDTDLKLLRKDSETDKQLIEKYKTDNRLIEMLLGLSCVGLGLLPTGFKIIEKGASALVAWCAIVILAIVLLGLIFVPSKIIRGEK